MTDDQIPEELTPDTGSEQGEITASTPEPTPQPTLEAEEAKDSAAKDAIVDGLFESAEKETPQPVEAEKTAPTSLELPVVRHPYDEEDDPNPDTFVDSKFSKIHENVDKLRGKLRKAREDGSFGRTLVELAAREGIPPAQLAEMVSRNVRLAKGDPAAIAEVAAELQQRGIKLAPEDKADPYEAEAKRIYDENFAEEVKGDLVDEDFARKKSRTIAERTYKPPVTPPPQIKSLAITKAEMETQREELAAAGVNRLATQYKEAYTKAGQDFTPIAEEAHKRIAAKVANTGKIPVDLWNYTYSETVREVQNERAKTKATPVAAPVRTGSPLRPTTTLTTINNKSVSAIKNALVDDLMSGN